MSSLSNFNLIRNPRFGELVYFNLRYWHTAYWHTAIEHSATWCLLSSKFFKINTMGGGGTIKCDVLCLVMMQCDQYNEQLRLKIDRLDLRKHFDCQKMSSDQHIYYDILQDLVRFHAVTTITLRFRLQFQSCCGTW